jgi:hypothetical protein
VDGGILFLQIGALVVCAIAGYVMLDRVDRGGTGVALGFFLGPIGLVIAWVMRDNALRDQAERQRHHDSRSAPVAPARRGFGSAAAARAESSAVSSNVSAPLEALERLATLREKGHLTDEEFEREKRKLIAPAPTPRTSRFR